MNLLLKEMSKQKSMVVSVPQLANKLVVPNVLKKNSNITHMMTKSVKLVKQDTI
jgi:hypothetical protein